MDTPAHSNDKKQTFTRRHFLELVGAGSIGVAAVGGLALSAAYLAPNVVKEPPTKFKIGTPAEYPPGSVTLDKEQKIFVVRAPEGYFYTLSATCTHLGCIVNWKADEGIVACPCHGSKFDREGNVIGGPAPRPLPRFSVTITDQGVLVVDKSLVVSGDTILKV